MAPATVDQQTFPSQASLSKGSLNQALVDVSLFPDGLKTSGQHPPLYDKIYPYSAFPKKITGPTLWHPSDYATHPERWVHPFTDSEIEALSSAADSFLDSGHPLTGISKERFALPEPFASSLAAMRTELLNGKGFILYKNIPVASWGPTKTATAYLGLGTHIGYPVSQNGKGHILGHVKDLGEDASQTDKVRIYRTCARQFFHSDDADVVGLLCCARAEEGGESDVSSLHAVWNLLQAERPDVAELLTKPVWWVDRKGEVSQGEDPYIRAAIFYLETPEDGQEQRLYSKWDPYYIRSLTRFSDQGIIPPLSAEQQEAAAVLEETAGRVKLHMVLDVGDVQFLSNSHVLHARTAYRDFAPHTGKPRRHLMRLWLATPTTEGGWRLPFKDAADRKRGGIQVDDQAPVARVDAD